MIEIAKLLLERKTCNNCGYRSNSLYGNIFCEYDRHTASQKIIGNDYKTLRFSESFPEENTCLFWESSNAKSS